MQLSENAVGALSSVRIGIAITLIPLRERLMQEILAAQIAGDSGVAWEVTE